MNARTRAKSAPTTPVVAPAAGAVPPPAPAEAAQVGKQMPLEEAAKIVAAFMPEVSLTTSPITGGPARERDYAAFRTAVVRLLQHAAQPAPAPKG